MLPLRQSCDRCHEHKVRCIRSISETTIPCVRCTRAGTSCIYSIQRKPGRRVSRKEATATWRRSAKNPTSPEPIPIEGRQESQTLPEEHPPDQWLPELDVLTASLPPASNMATADDSLYFCAAPLESSFDTTQTYIDQLARLVITIGRSTSTLFSQTSTPPLSASSPPFNEICASARTLTMIAAQLSEPATRQTELDMNMPELDPQLESVSPFDYLPNPPSTDDKPPDLPALLSPGTLMMILACYQRLLAAFGAICLSMQQRLHEMEMNSLMGPISSPTLSPNSDTLQFIMMIQLMSDLSKRLDRSLAPLVSSVDLATGGGLSLPPLPPQDMSLSPASSSSSSSLSSTATSPSIEHMSEYMGGEVGAFRSTGGMLSMRAGEQLRQQQSRLHALIKTVKRLVRSQKL